jgi:hypothetical protein
MEKIMTKELKDRFIVADTCRKELLNIRDLFTNQNISESAWDELETTLAIMYLHCPEEMCSIVLRTIEEMIARKPLVKFKGEVNDSI